MIQALLSSLKIRKRRHIENNLSKITKLVSEWRSEDLNPDLIGIKSHVLVIISYWFVLDNSKLWVGKPAFIECLGIRLAIWQVLR